jgi:hypothetical protein
MWPGQTDPPVSECTATVMGTSDLVEELPNAALETILDTVSRCMCSINTADMFRQAYRL